MKRHLTALALLALLGLSACQTVADMVDATGGWPIMTECSGRGSNFSCVSQ